MNPKSTKFQTLVDCPGQKQVGTTARIPLLWRRRRLVSGYHQMFTEMKNVERWQLEWMIWLFLDGSSISFLLRRLSEIHVDPEFLCSFMNIHIDSKFETSNLTRLAIEFALRNLLTRSGPGVSVGRLHCTRNGNWIQYAMIWRPWQRPGVTKRVLRAQ